jgi:lipoate-protein ligase A
MPRLKLKNFLIIVLAILVLSSFVVGFVVLKINKEKISKNNEKTIEMRIKELDDLSDWTPPLTQEEIEQHLEDLNRLSASTPSLTEDQIKERLKELDELNK